MSFLQSLLKVLASLFFPLPVAIFRIIQWLRQRSSKEEAAPPTYERESATSPD